jgi:enoyl-[acyl-carrier protein] reductase II
MMKNDFANRAVKAEDDGWNEEQLRELLGRKRERLGIFEGDEIEGEMEAGQSAGLVNEILPVSELFKKLLKEIEETIQRNKRIISGPQA